jgi:hypothetical protein
MKKTILIFSIAFSSLSLSGQVDDNNKLRFVAAFPDYNYIPETSELINVSALLRVKKDSLIEEILLTDSLQRLDFLRCYPEYNVLIAMTKGKRTLNDVVPGLSYQITIVDTKSLKKEMVQIPDLIKSNGVSYSFYGNELSTVIENNKLQFILKYVNFDVVETKNTTGILYYLFDPGTHISKIVDPGIYKNAIANSGNLVLTNNYEGEILKGDTITNVLKIATTKFYENPIYCDYLPKDVKISRKSYAYAAATVLINNNKILALYLYEREQRGKWVFCKVHVYNKEQKTWAVFEIETSWVIAKYYDKYLAGNYRVTQVKSNDSDFPFQSNYWIKEKTKYGPSYQYLFIESPVSRYHSQGDLYLYNIDTKSLIKWNTGHGDSEILLVQNEVVYYRVNDKIFKAQILNREELDIPTLIIQDERVSDIHWAFLSNNIN